MGALDDFRRPTCIHRSANRLCGSSYRKESTWTQLSVWPPKPFIERITEAAQRRQVKPLPYDQRGNLFDQEGEPIKQRDSLGCQIRVTHMRRLLMIWDVDQDAACTGVLIGQGTGSRSHRLCLHQQSSEMGE